MAHASRGRTFHECDFGTVEIRWDGPLATVLINGVESSCINTQNPADLDFEYMQHASCALEALYPTEAKIRTLHLGGAGCALPAAWAHTYPNSRNSVVEIDAALAQQVREWFDLPKAPRLSIRVGDGREVLESARPQSFDVIVRDAFTDGVVPAHMRTHNFTAAAFDALKPGGLFIANCAHGGGVDARADIASISAVFPEVISIQDPKVGRSGRRGNVLAVASKAPLGSYPLAELDRLLRKLPLPARPKDSRELAQWCAGVAPLSDAANTAPHSGEAPHHGVEDSSSV